jgi:chromosome segregation ATPase
MSNEMLEKLKHKIEEIDEKRSKTEADQKKLIESSGKFNEKIRTFIEYKNLEKSAYNEGYVKIQAINQRIQDSSTGIEKLKDKLIYINSLLENKRNISVNNAINNNTKDQS